jgi:hypothetical protein
MHAGSRRRGDAGASRAVNAAQLRNLAIEKTENDFWTPVQ